MHLESIRMKTALVLLFISIFIVLVLGGLWMYSTYQTVKYDIELSNLQDARLLAGYFGSFFHDIAGDEIVAAGSPDTIEAIEQGDTGLLRVTGDNLAKTPDTDVVIILDKNKKVLYHSLGANTTNFLASGYFDTTLKMNDTYITDLYYSHTLQNYVFSVASPVRDNGSVIGIIVMSVSSDTVQQMVNSQRIDPTRNIFIVDNRGIVVATDSNTSVPANTDISHVSSSQKATNGSEGLVETRNTYDKQFRIVGFSPIRPPLWGALVSTPISIVYSQIFEKLIYIIVLILGLLSLILLGSFYLSGYLTKPILELSNTMEKVGAGDFKVRAKAERKDEIGNLSRSFNSMMDGLERTVELEHIVELTKRYRLILQGARDPIFFTELDGKIIDVNDAAIKTYGYSNDELRTMQIADIRIPEERLKLKDQLQLCTLKGCEFETVHQRKDGTSFPVEVSCSGTMIDNREVIICIVRDVTERKRAEEELRKLSLAVEQSPAIVIVTDIDGKIEYVNEKFVSITGYSKEEARGKNPRILKSGEMPESFYKELWDTIRSGKIWRGEFHNKKKNGELYWESALIAPVKNIQGKIEHYIAVKEDITELKQARIKLETLNSQLIESNTSLVAISDILTAAITTLDLDKLLSNILNKLNLVMNSNASVIMLQDDNHLIVTSSVGLEEEARERYAIPVGEGFAGTIASTKKPLYVEDAQIDPRVLSPFIKKAGIRSMLGVPLMFDNAVLGVLHIDWLTIHPYNEREKNLLQVIANRCTSAILNARLYDDTLESHQQAQLYVDIMGHDINNLNMIALANLELIEDDENLLPEQKEAIKKAMLSTQNSSVIIDNVRKLQKLTEEELPLETIDINDLILDCIKEAPHPEGKAVTINYMPRPGMLIKGIHLLKEVFCNLISNSIKYSGPEVTIEITSDEAKIRDKMCYRITITDNGFGIPDEVKPKLFTRFQRGTTKAHGKGLGLYIVRTLLEKYGGSIDVEDRVPGSYRQGAKFIVVIPIWSG